MITIIESIITQVIYSILILLLLGVVLRRALTKFTSLELSPQPFPFIPEKNRTFGKSAAVINM
jgi:hypothetical protein